MKKKIKSVNVRKMTDRQKKYRENRIAGMNQYNAARAAGYSDSVARTACRRVEAKVNFTDVLEQAGATLTKVAGVLNTALTATKIQNVNIILKKNAAGKLEVQEADDFIEVDDWYIRLAAAKQILELNKLANGKNGNGSGATVETFFIELLKKREKELADGKGIRITRVEHSALDRFIQK